MLQNVYSAVRLGPHWGELMMLPQTSQPAMGTPLLISLLPRHIEVSAFVTLNTWHLTLILLSHFDQLACL